MNSLAQSVKLSNRERRTKNRGFWGGFRGLGGGRILILEQYAKRIVITKPHTKFERTSSKRLKLSNREKNRGFWFFLGG